MNQHMVAHADTPSFANEGWAECHSFAPGTRSLNARRAHAPLLRTRGQWVPLRDLGGPGWYHQHSGPVYEEGHLWVDFLLRRYGIDRFIEFCNTCRPETFDADCRRVFGPGADELETMLWRDLESTTPRPTQ
jgi:hypothetical protein